MPKIPDSSDPADWHRYFAALCNNRAWELAVKDRTAEEDAEMLNMAHASAVHWDAVGSELNRMRARTLLAEVHALLGFGQSALALAEEIRAFFLGRETEDWEIAYAHAIHAHAAAAAGEKTAHASSHAAAETAVAAIRDDADRRIVLETFERVPRPQGES
jgi:hypothetical protein